MRSVSSKVLVAGGGREGLTRHGDGAVDLTADLEVVVAVVDGAAQRLVWAGEHVYARGCGFGPGWRDLSAAGSHRIRV